MPYDDGTSVLVAVDIPEELLEVYDTDGIKKTSVSDRVRSFLKGTPEKVEENFGLLTDSIIRYSKPLIKSFQKLHEEDSLIKTASAEFSLSFNGKGNIYLVETTVEGAIKVSLEWDLERKTEQSN